MKTVKVLLVVLVVGVLAACSSQKTKPPAKPAAKGTAIPAARTIYFDFDKSEVKEEGRVVVDSHSGYLKSNRGAKVVLEGHCDERGSREYNVGLGERRSQAVRRLMLFQGVSDAQLETVSYGEERPAVVGHNESAWSKNRRVEIVYK
jgi:peptidoglycan-associated lipoprotein